MATETRPRGAGDPQGAPETAIGSVAFLASLLDTATDAIVIVQNGATIRMANAAAELLFGRPRAEMIGRPIELLVPAGLPSSPRFGRRHATGLSQRGAPEQEVCGITRDGRTFAVEVSQTATETDQGVIVTARFRDALERRQTETVAARLAAIVASTDDAVIGKTLDGRITSWNRAAEQIYGYSAAEAVGRHIAFLLDPGQEDEVEMILARLAAGDRVDHLETTRRRRDGRRVDVSLTISPISDHTGRVIGASTIARDVTERRAAAERLRQSEQLYRTTVDHAPTGIGMLSLDGRWLGANRSLCEMTGYGESDLAGRSFREIKHPDDPELDPGMLQRLLTGELDRIDADKRYIRADGSVMHARVSISMVRDSNGTPQHRVIQIQDVTRALEGERRLSRHARAGGAADAGHAGCRRVTDADGPGRRGRTGGRGHAGRPGHRGMRGTHGRGPPDRELGGAGPHPCRGRDAARHRGADCPRADAAHRSGSRDRLRRAPGDVPAAGGRRT